MTNASVPPVPRRSFLSRFGLGLAAFGGAFGQGASAQAPASPTSRWQPTRHPQDDWLDRVPGQHRMIFDSTMPDGLGGAMFYANNLFTANQNGYGLAGSEVAIVIVMRHNSTPFAYTDAMWAKYGVPLSERARIVDPKTGQAPKVNINNASTPQNYGATLDGLIAKGAHFAVCEMATRRLAGTIAQATGGNAETVYKELVANLIGNSHMVAAGILAVNRAQERGYAFASAGV
jgi:intracellular sulfur oxidation DsrE/DsrF family protein